MNAWKRRLAGALSAVMLFSLIPAPTFAGEMEADEETLFVAEPVADTAYESGEASVTDSEGGSAETVILEAVSDDATVNGAADDIYEVGYRFSEKDPWTIVGTDKDNPHGVGNYEVFDENRNYAIDLSDAFPTKDDVTFPLPVYIIVWDAAGGSEELKDGDKPYQFEDETKVITIERGKRYSLSVYADWLEEFSYQAGTRMGRNATTDKDWYNAHSTAYPEEDNAGTVSISLRRTETFPFPVKFSVPDGASPLTFSNASAEGDVTIDEPNQTVTFLTQDAAVVVKRTQGTDTAGREIVSETTFKVHDPYYGEVSYTLNEAEGDYMLGYAPDVDWITFGSDDKWAQEYPDNYKTEKEKNFFLGDNDRFPFRVKFYMRGVSDPAKAFFDEQGVERDANSFVVSFQRQDASVKVGDYTFKAHDERAGEVRYSTAHVGAKTLTRDKDWAEKTQNKNTYVYKEASENSHVIQLTENDTFPVDVKFLLPRDAVSELDISGDALTTGKAENKGRNADGSYTVSFKENDTSVTAGGYTFTVHSRFEGAVRCEIVGSGRKVTVGAVNDHNTKYATETLNKANEKSGENWKNNPDGNSERVRPGYILFGANETVIELKEGEYFPCEVRFTEWKPDTGWDEDNAKTETFNSVKNADGTPTEIDAFGHKFAIHADWLDEVKYELPGKSPVIVCSDAEKAAALTHYELFNGQNFAIDPDESTVFPCTVTFTVRNTSGSETVTEETFKDSNDTTTVEIRGHMFGIRSAWKGEVVYSLSYKLNGETKTESKTVGYDGAWAETHNDYDALPIGKDGERVYAYVIKPEYENLSFPVKVTFQMRDSSNKSEVEFKNLEDTHKYAGITFSIHPVWLDTVKYTVTRDIKNEDGAPETKTLTVTVGTDADEAKRAKEKADAAEEDLKKTPFAGIPAYIDAEDENHYLAYILADDGKYLDEQGNIKIQGVEDDAFYPYGIQFTETRPKKSGNFLTPNNVTRTVWFEAPKTETDAEDNVKVVNDVKEIGGYRFVAISNRTDPAKLVSAGLRINAVQDKDSGKWTGGQYIPFVKDIDDEETRDIDEADSYWDDTQKEKEYQASMQSLLPLRERGLYINLRGFFRDELKNVRLEFVRADIPGKLPAKDSVAWGEPIREGVSSGTYTIIDNINTSEKNQVIDVSGQTYYEMIAGQLDQLNMSDIRYIVRVTKDPPGFGSLIKMKAAYADAERSGIRIKGSGYGDGVYRFTVNEQWQDGSVNVTMWLNEDADDYPYFKELQARVYEGGYALKAFKDAGSNVKEITDKVWNQELDLQPENQRYATNLVSEKQDDNPYFTIVWYRDGTPVAAMPFQIRVRVEPDKQWVDDDAEPDDTTPTNRITLSPPKTNNTTIKNKDGGYDQWDFSRGIRFYPEEPEPYEVTVYHYKVPDNEDFSGIAMDRFYVSARYWHHTRKGSLDSDGKKVEKAFDEPGIFDQDTGEFIETDYSYYYQNAESDGRNGKAVWQKYGVKVYAGPKPYLTSAEAQADANASDVTAQIFTETGYGAEYSNTIYFSFMNAEGKRFDCRGVQIQSETRIEYGDMTLRGDNSFRPRRIENAEDDNGDNGDNKDTIIWRMPDESYPATGMYSVRIKYQKDYKDIDWKAEGVTVWVSDEDCSAKPFDELEDFAEDVTEKALTDPGYAANYSFGVHFHIYDKSGKLLSHKKIITEAALPSAKSADTWFQIQGALKKANSWGDKDRYVGFAMPYTADDYYDNGYQTIFLMDRETDEAGNYKLDEKTGEYIYIPIKNGSEFYPYFWNDEGKNTIYGMHDEGGEIQKSGENKKVFQEDNTTIIEYSAAAQNGRHLRNYWVTFLTQHKGGAKIFVNTANDKSHQLPDLDEHGKPMINREVFIANSEKSHDIFFANIGDKTLTNLDVKLWKDKEKTELLPGGVIRLDEYWDLDVERELAPYSTILGKDMEEKTVQYGGLRNIAKIRIWNDMPETSKTPQAIDAYLTISGTDESGQPIAQTIHLSGTVGAVRIDKPAAGNLRPAVKYVPYANLIRTNNIYGGETVKFKLSGSAPQGVTNGAVDSASPEQYRHYYGRLPNGMELRSNGEIYGAPTEIGLFTFTVTANFSYAGTDSSDSREYTLEVKTNSDYNVWMENDWQRDGFAEEEADWSDAKKDNEKFGVEYWIPDMVINNTTEDYDHTAPYQAAKSVPGDGQLIDESKLTNGYATESTNFTGTDERRNRTTKHATPPTNDDGTAWTAYHDVVFGIKNYNDVAHYEEGEGDYEWFMSLWINGKKLNGYRVPDDEKTGVSRKGRTDEEYRKALLEWVAKQTDLRSVYDFFYGNGCFYGVGTGESVAANSNTDGSPNTGSVEFRVNGDSNNTQRTASQNYTVDGPKGTKTPKKQEKPKKDDPKKEDPVNPGGGGGGGGGGGSTYYAISTKFNDSQGKSVKLSDTSAKAGKKITVTVTPWDGYETESVSVSYGKSKSVSVKRNGNKYTFTMPGANVTVNVTFKLAGPSVFTARVTEVAGGKVSLNINSGTQGTEIYATVTPDVGRVVKSLLVNGGKVDAYLLETNKDTNEAIYRFYLPAGNVTVVPEYAWETLAEFADINGSMWFFQNAKWAYKRGIFQGVTPYDWMPEDMISSFTAVVTLGRLANLDEDTLARYAAANPADYPGIPDGDYAPYARWAMDCGILQWGVYGNKETLTRAELALMLKRFIELQGIALEVPVGEARTAFTDQEAIDVLGADTDAAFQALNKIGVFQGRSDGSMNPSGNTKRSHLAALLNRVSDFIQQFWTKKNVEQEQQEPAA